MTSSFRWTALTVLALAASNCAPTHGADPLNSAQASAGGLRPLSTNPTHVQDERLHAANHELAAESDEGNSFHGSVGMSTAADW